jgi:type I restriction enzyme, R subunit
VLKFSVEYIRTFKRKDMILDIEVEAIDEAEVMEAPQRLKNIVDYIISNHDRKTHAREFTGLFCVSSVPTLIEYKKLFDQRREEGKHNLKVATIFSYQQNEDDKEAVGFIDDEFDDLGDAENGTISFRLNKAADGGQPYLLQHSRDVLEAFIALLQVAPTVNSVNNLPSEEEEPAFIQSFRELMRLEKVTGNIVFGELHGNKRI